jgi:metal-responsive CopG/Arc/MetJ family transcriptional regulator
MGHTKLAISLPDDLYSQLNESAKADGTTRSSIVAEALERHFERQTAAAIRAAWNAVYSEPLNDDEAREEESLARERDRAFRRINELLSAEEDAAWQT